MGARLRAARSFRRLSDRLLTDDRTFARLQRVLRASLEARRRVDRNLLRIFAALNLPSYTEVAQIEEQVALLEEDVGRIAERIARLTRQLEGEEAGGKR